jgi:hypothetical protein
VPARAAWWSVAVVATALALAAHARAAAPIHPVDPNDAVYRDLDRWEALGYLPPGDVLRPWSPEALRAALQRVLLHAQGADRERVELYLQQLGEPRFAPRVFSRATLRTSGDAAATVTRAGVGAELQALRQLVDTLWLSGAVGLQYADPPARAQPVGERSDEDYLTTGISGEPTTFYYGLDSALTLGGPGLWTGLAFARSSAGPFYSNGVVLGPQALATPNWSVHGAFGPFRIATSLHQLMPWAPDGSGGFRALQLNKYLVFHSYSFALGSRLDVGLYEAAVWAGDFKPLYLVPFSFFYFLQASASFADNSLAGLYAKWRPVDGLVLKGVAYFDDVQAADIPRFKLDTKIIGAVQAGVAWAPAAGPLALLELDYTGVFPYMYTHWEDTFAPGGWDGAAWGAEWQQNNYTHAGDGLGAALLPNSDRWELRGRFGLRPALELDAVARLIRHGNASVGVPGDKGGGYFDDGRVGEGWSYQEPYASTTSPRYFRFLTQEVLDTTAALGVALAHAQPLRFGALTIRLRYLVEYRQNAELVAGLRQVHHYLGYDVALGL